jgi:predicted chitinase
MWSLFNYADNNSKSFEIMRAILDKAKLDAENIRGLNLTVVKHMTVHVNKIYYNLNYSWQGIICCLEPDWRRPSIVCTEL